MKSAGNALDFRLWFMSVGILVVWFGAGTGCNAILGSSKLDGETHRDGAAPYDSATLPDGGMSSLCPIQCVETTPGRKPATVTCVGGLDASNSSFATDRCVVTNKILSDLNRYRGCSVTLRVTDQKTGKSVQVTQEYPDFVLDETKCERFCNQYDKQLSVLDSNEGTKIVAGSSGETNTVRLWGVENGVALSGQAFGAFSELILNFNFINNENQRNIDIGGGGYNHTSAILYAFGILNYVYDPFRRGEAHNAEVLTMGNYDSATSFSVLNVIEKAEERKKHVALTWKSLRCEGVAYFKVYEGGRFETAGAFQMRQPTMYYMDLIKEVFGSENVTIKEGDKLIIARKRCATPVFRAR